MAKSNGIPTWGWVAIVLAALLFFNVGGSLDYVKGKLASSGSDNPTTIYTVDKVSSTSLQISVQNILNTTGSEKFTVTGYVFDSDGNWVKTITDTYTPTGVDVNYGDEYTIKFVGSDDANSKIKKVISGKCSVASDGSVTVKADSGEVSCVLGGTQHGALQFRLYDDDEMAFVYGDGTGDTGWQGDGVTFSSTTNGSAKTVDTNGYLHGTLYVKGVGNDKDFQDYYVLVLVDAPLTEFKEPSMMSFDGVSLSEIKDSLTSEEKTKFAEYEYVYKITAPFEDTIHKLEFYIEAKDGANPSTDPQIDFAVAGNYKSTVSYDVKTGAVKDDSSNTVVYDIMDTAWDIA